MHLFHFFAPLGFSTLENNNSAKETISYFLLAVEKFLAPCTKFFELFFPCLKILLLSLELNQLMLALLKLCA
ncbi:MAG: hypothetical protein EBT48_07770 [Verrucomicrobia bacterium]|nr:hypothetical protein [Verrucomicrobiota bacterium]